MIGTIKDSYDKKNNGLLLSKTGVKGTIKDSYDKKNNGLLLSKTGVIGTIKDSLTTRKIRVYCFLRQG